MLGQKQMHISAFPCWQLYWSLGEASVLMSLKDVLRSASERSENKEKSMQWVIILLSPLLFQRGKRGVKISVNKQCLMWGSCWNADSETVGLGRGLKVLHFWPAPGNAGASAGHTWNGEWSGKMCAPTGSDSGCHCCTIGMLERDEQDPGLSRMSCVLVRDERKHGLQCCFQSL